MTPVPVLGDCERYADIKPVLNPGNSLVGVECRTFRCVASIFSAAQCPTLCAVYQTTEDTAYKLPCALRIQKLQICYAS